MNAALKLHPTLDQKVLERRAMLVALPLRDEPESEEERAMFEEAERAIAAGDHGIPDGEAREMLEQMRRTAAE